MKVKDIRLETLKNISSTELRSLHYKIHQLYGTKEYNKEEIINAHLWIIQEMQKRDTKHNIVSEIDRETERLYPKQATNVAELGYEIKIKKMQLLKAFCLKTIIGDKILLLDYEASLYDILHKSGYNIYATTFDTKEITSKVLLINNINTPFKDNNFDTVIGYNLIKNKLEDRDIIKELVRVSKNRVIIFIDFDKKDFADLTILNDWIKEIADTYTIHNIDDKQFGIIINKLVTLTQSAIYDNMQSFVIVPDFVHLVGSSAKDKKGKDIDILFKQDHKDSSLELKFSKSFPLEIRNKLHFIYNSSGPHDDCIPLGHLAIIKKKDFKKQVVELSDRIVPLKWFQPLKTRGGIDKLEFFNVDNAWDNWAISLISRGIVIEPNFDGYRVQLHKSLNRVAIYTENMKTDILKNMPHVTEEIRDVINVNRVILDGKLMAYNSDGSPMSREELAIYTVGKNPDDTKVKIQFFDCLNYEGENLTDKQWKERTSYLSKVFTRNYKYITKVGYKIVTSKSDFFDTINQMSKVDGSEGAMLKLIDSTYPTTGKTSDWAKYKITHEIDVRVKEVIQTKIKKVYNYRIEILGIRGQLIDCGKTMNTSIKTNIGDIITVAVFKIYEDKDGTYNCLNAMVKSVKKGRTKPDTEILAKRIAKETGRRTQAEALEFAFKFDYKSGSITMEPGMRGKYIVQTHRSGKSIHSDLRMQVLSPERREYLEGLTLDTPGNQQQRNKFLESESNEKIVCQIKSKQPIEWLRVQGTFPAGSIGATRFQPGTFKIVEKGSFVCGEQDEHFKEFFLETSNKKIKGKWVLQFVPVGEGWTKVKGKRVWMFSKIKKNNKN